MLETESRMILERYEIAIPPSYLVKDNKRAVEAAEELGYPGLQGKKLDPEKLDLWNRLYGPEAFTPYGRPSWGGVEGAPIAEERKPVEKIEPEAKEEPKPSVAKPGAKAPSAVTKEEKVRSRLDRLGY